MNYSESIAAYFAAYNTKVSLENDPLLESGVIDAEAAALTGTVELNQVRSYDETVAKIDTEIPGRIAELQQELDTYAPTIVEFFETVAPDLEFVYSDDRTQKISVESGEVVIT